MSFRSLFPIQTTWSPSQTVHIAVTTHSYGRSHMSKFHFPSNYVKNLSFRSSASRPISSRKNRQPSSPDDEFYDLDKFIFAIHMICPLTHGPVWQISREWTRGSRAARGGVRGISEPVGRNLIWLIFISELKSISQRQNQFAAEIGPRFRMTTIFSDGVISLTCKMGLKQVHIWFHMAKKTLTNGKLDILRSS